MGILKARIDEGINRVTTIDLELAAKEALSADGQESAVGQAIQLIAEDVIEGSVKKVRFDGVIFELIDVTGDAGSKEGVYYYSLLVRPALWKLNYHVNSRSYPNKSRSQVIDALLASHGMKEKSA